MGKKIQEKNAHETYTCYCIIIILYLFENAYTECPINVYACIFQQLYYFVL